MFSSQPALAAWRQPQAAAAWRRMLTGTAFHFEAVRVAMAARYCDELIALKEGRLLRRGPPAEFMRGGVLKDVFGVEMGVLEHSVTGQPIGYVQ